MENFKFAIVEIKIGILENGVCFYYYFSCYYYYLYFWGFSLLHLQNNQIHKMLTNKRKDIEHKPSRRLPPHFALEVYKSQGEEDEDSNFLLSCSA